MTRLLGIDIGTTATKAIVIDADAVRLSQILANLLDNAGKWARSKIVLSFTCNSEGAVTATISDDGPGIPEHELARVFELGVRLDSSMPGSGLGLAIARDLAKALGLELTLVNRPIGLAGILSPAPCNVAPQNSALASELKPQS